MISRMLTMMNDVSFTKTSGKFVSDKSYAYDTIFFIANYVKANLKVNESGKKYFIRDQEEFDNIKRYIQKIFKLDPTSDGSQNYFLETMNLFVFANLFSEEKIDRRTKHFHLNHEEIFDWITSGFENSYIFLYILVYQTMVRDNILPLYTTYLINQNKDNLDALYRGITNISVSVGKSSTQWSQQIVKYCVLILGYANKGKVISREFNIKDRIIDIGDISINKTGTRTKPEFSKKNNGYFSSFSKEYVLTQFIDQLIVSTPMSASSISNSVVYSDLVEQIVENIKLTDEKFDSITEIQEESFTSLIQRPISTRIVSGARKENYESLNKIKKDIGDSGEQLILRYEKNKLKDTNFVPVRVSDIDDTLGYDIKSYDLLGNEIYIEVKTQARGKLESGVFYLSANEKSKLDEEPKYVIYFVFNLNNNRAQFIKIKKSDLDTLTFEPVIYKIRFKAVR